MQTATLLSTISHMCLNLLFNAADILLEILDAYLGLSSGDYSLFGVAIGKILSDLFIKNPLDPDWQTHNSQILSQDEQLILDEYVANLKHAIKL